jgi:alkanesulfonate monooxygenase SsuD/methylene tetrahydromethanopterin reductase-like flavin-dependent oxidoreductase (luciferase family)
MNVQEYNAMKARRAELNARQEKLRLEAQQLVAMAETAKDTRAKLKSVVAELDQQLQAYEREHAAKPAPVVVVKVARQPEPVPVAQASRWELFKAAMFGAK